MKFLLLAFLLSVVVIGHLNAASSLEEDIIGEQLWEALQSADDDESYEKRGSKLSFEHRPQDPRLRGCIHCVGQQREKGKKVKEATNYCNKICRRSLYDTRSIFDDEENDFY